MIREFIIQGVITHLLLLCACLDITPPPPPSGPHWHLADYLPDCHQVHVVAFQTSTMPSMSSPFSPSLDHLLHGLNAG
jgi:hypothetical protein